jgi:hypothetical protein
LRYLTMITATQMPHIVQTGLAECLGLSAGSVRVISPDVGGGFGYKGVLSREEVTLGWLALNFGQRTRGRPVPQCAVMLYCAALPPLCCGVISSSHRGVLDPSDRGLHRCIGSDVGRCVEG